MSNQHEQSLSDLEPEIARTLSRVNDARNSGPYELCQEDELRARLEPFLSREGASKPKVTELRRLAGGASKEQFVFKLSEDGGAPRRCVLRLEPVEGVALTSRQRESEGMRAVRDVAPGSRSILGRSGR